MSESYVKFVADFLRDDNDYILGRLKEFSPGSGDSQIAAWKTLIGDLKLAIEKSDLSRDAVISIEYKLPTGGMGIDVLICGSDEKNVKKCFIIESKQWNDEYIFTHTFSDYREDGRELHPQIQVYRHKLSFKDYTDCGCDFEVTPFVFIRNCSEKGIKEIVEVNPNGSSKNIAVHNNLDKIIRIVSASIAAGSEEMIEKLRQAKYKPSKDIISAMQAIAALEEPFVLTDEQVAAVKEIKRSIKAGKKIIRITGAAGSGKTAILLNLYIELLNGDFGDVRPVFVPGAQNTAFYKGEYPQI